MTSDASYGEFAYIYDALTDDVEYEKRAKYIKTLIQRHRSEKSTLLCDLGCGTGSMCRLLSGYGFDVIGIDNSDAMLSVAAEKNTDGKVLYLCQDMTDFELYGTVDVCTCLLDSINYVTDLAELDRMFALVNNYLNPGGMFIFDVNTEHKFRDILGNNTYVYEKDNIFYTWENFYEDGILDFYLNFFIEQDGVYRRASEHHVQRYHCAELLKRLCVENGLTVEAVYDDLTQNLPSSDSERVFFVVKKLGSR